MPHHDKDNSYQDILELLANEGFEALPDSLRLLLNAAMRLEREEYPGAGAYERTEQRRGYANGFKQKTIQTRVGSLDVDVPQTRDGGFYPNSLERGIRSEKALKLALAEMYVQGVSTRKVAAITEAQAHQAMRLLRALFNYAEAVLEDASGKPIVAHNPVRRLTQIKAWNKIPRRQTVIHSRDLPKWFGAVNQLQSDTARDFLILLLFTGLRRSEVATLTWKQIDFDLLTLTITSDVAKNSREHRLPLTDFLIDLLQARRDKYSKKSAYVFPGLNGEAHFTEPKSAINIVIGNCGVKFSCHDLRRTFITIAESLDIPYYALKRLVNHKGGGDVTAGYIVTEVERLRVPMQRITDCIRERIKQTDASPELDSAGA